MGTGDAPIVQPSGTPAPLSLPADGPEGTGHPGRPARRRWRAAVLAASAISLAVLAGIQAVGPDPGAGDSQAFDAGIRAGPAPDFRLPSLTESSTTVALADYRGRPLVINFWASWCVPCRREMPLLAAASRRLGGRVAFVGVNYRDQREDALDLLHETGVTYPSGVDGDGTVGGRYGLFGLPTTVFISPEGRIVGRYMGELSAKRLDAFLRRLQAQPPATVSSARLSGRASPISLIMAHTRGVDHERLGDPIDTQVERCLPPGIHQTRPRVPISERH